jgi:hypothetical protein
MTDDSGLAGQRRYGQARSTMPASVCGVVALHMGGVIEIVEYTYKVFNKLIC